MSFQSPFLLLFLLGLPVLWWLARATPPLPHTQSFPSLLLLRTLRPRRQDASHTPWWLLVLRLMALGLLILACAGPIWHAPASSNPSHGKQIILLDNGWAAGPFWKERLHVARALGEQAFRAGSQPVYVLTAPQPDGQLAEPLFPDNSRMLSTLLNTVHAQPWPVARTTVARQLAASDWQARLKDATVTVLSDGVQQGGETALKQALQNAGKVFDMRWNPCAMLRLTAAPPEAGQRAATTLKLHVERLPNCTEKTSAPLRGLTLAGAGQTPPAQASSSNGANDLHFDTLIRWTVPVGTGTQVSLPSPVASSLDAVALENVAGPAGIVLFGGGSHQKTLGLLSLNGDSMPLLGNAFYLTRALGNDLRTGSLESLLAAPLSILIAPDGTLTTPDAQKKVGAWVKQGGMLVRFAGPSLAETEAVTPEAQALLPVRLMHGQRQLGGPMSWGKPQPLAPFPPHSPFSGLTIPPDITVSRQVLAQPGDDLQNRSWASLADGTPLVTARHEGRGMVVLFHITPTAAWSNLALSGLFPAMLDRLVADAPALSNGTTVTSTADSLLLPWRIVTMTNSLARPNVAAEPLQRHEMLPPVSVRHPAGLYGQLPQLRPLNLSGPLVAEPLLGTLRTPQSLVPAAALGAPFALLALLLLMIDGVLALLRTTHLHFRKILASQSMGFGLFMAFGLHAPAQAEAPHAPIPSTAAPAGALETRLAAIKTGDVEMDHASQEGLEGLTRFLNQRSTTHLGTPVEVDPDHDNLGFYPLIYWPITANVQSDPARTSALNDYMKHGGLLMIDELGAGSELNGASATSARKALQRATEGLEIPPLMKLDEAHTLSHTFYLLHTWPGRIDGQPVYVARTGNDAADAENVSPVIIGNGDWARAWAVDASGTPPFAVVPDGENQRTLAYRFGVNAVIYALTGNYKNDQKHYPEMLKRLGGNDDGAENGDSASPNQDAPNALDEGDGE